MLIRCESCKRSYDFDINDGLCPKCGCYNNISDAMAYRLEAKREARRVEACARQSGSLCDAQDNSTYMAGRYAPDCMEDSHDPRHAHTGGTNVQRSERVLPPVPKVPLSMSRTPVRDSYARKVNGITPQPGSAGQQKSGGKKMGCGAIIAILIALLTLLSNLYEALG